MNLHQQQILDHYPIHMYRFHELMFTYVNIAANYYQSAEQFNPTKQDYSEWLEGLHGEFKQEMKEKGFDNGRKIPAFARFVLEKNDVGMDDYMRKYMGADDFEEYLKLISFDGQK
jgi:hypothetical protein